MKKTSYLSLVLLIASMLCGQMAFAQDDEGFNPIKGGSVRGNVQLDAQYYPVDKGLGVTKESLDGKQFGLNGFANVIYNYRNFSAGLRFEGFLNPMIGFDPNYYEGLGVPYWFVNYKVGKLNMTAGHFYEQFGSGLVLRTYEEWNLGYDNNLYGFNASYNPYDGINIKGLVGVQRFFWKPYEKDRGIVRGLDGDFALNDIILGSERAASNKVRVTIGGSFVSRYFKQQNRFQGYRPIYGDDGATIDSIATVEAVMPTNVASWAARLSLEGGGFNWYAEYAQKGNDPSLMNGYLYNKGQALYTTLSYSTKGLGVLVGYKWIDNMSFKSEPNQLSNPAMLDINYLPAITKEHSYGLATMYPYATKPNGEAGIQGQVIYTIPRRTKIGGRYGTTITVNYSLAKDIKRDYAAADSVGGIGYKANIFSMGETTFHQEFNAEIERKLSKNWKIKLAYFNQKYNKYAIEDDIYNDDEVVLANIAVADVTWSFKTNYSLRLELQGLFTSKKDKYYEDKGDWVAALLEFNVAPKWFVSIGDEWNYNNPNGDNLHYYNFAVGYTEGSNRISLRYGRQREGLLCVGGVCRYVPQSTGLTLSLTSSF